MVTVGGKKPTYVAKENVTSDAVQKAIDAAAGRRIVLGPGLPEMVLMWKRASAGRGGGLLDLNANAIRWQVDPWRRKVDCLFGLV